MNLGNIVKYVNAAYAGLMIGLAAYFVILIKHGYTFITSSSISISQLFSSGALGPLALGIIPWTLMIMIIATIFIVLINMIYENSLRPIRREKEKGKEAKIREERKARGKSKR
ncbi:MAG: hypothetical protein ACP5GZ_02125 [Vulcanisaeta sp.]|jgi:uncharacterized membrane protein|uniref:hypothetical protein n=1 Tax=Vulcanisaeta sp. TaxID=2020871 RepID=UPI003D0CED89